MVKIATIEADNEIEAYKKYNEGKESGNFNEAVLKGFFDENKDLCRILERLTPHDNLV